MHQPAAPRKRGVRAARTTSEHPELGLDALARGDPPAAEARMASLLCYRIHALRAAIRDYRQIALHQQPDDDDLF